MARGGRLNESGSGVGCMYQGIRAWLVLRCLFGFAAPGLAATAAIAFASEADSALTLAGDAPIGFGRATTGAGKCGADLTCVCHVRTPTQAAVEACVSGDRPALVVFDQPDEITVNELRIGSNKTIQGPVTLTGDWKLVIIDGSSNIVIRDVTFHSTLVDRTPRSDCATPLRADQVLDCGTMIGLRGNARNVWIDHNEFYDCGDKCITSWAFLDDEVPPESPLPAPDLVTVSNNIFRDSYYAVLIGVTKNALPSQVPTRQRLTFYGNLFDNVYRRSPRVAYYAWAHVFNNLVVHWGGCFYCSGTGTQHADYHGCRGPNYGFATSSGGGAQLVAENNHYEAWPGNETCKQAVKVDTFGGALTGGDELPGLVRVRGNILGNGSVEAENEPSNVFDPADAAQTEAYYPYPLLAADQVMTYVRTNAGPRRGQDTRKTEATGQ